MRRRATSRRLAQAGMSALLACAAAAGLGAGSALAQGGQGPTGCLDDPVHRAFDFWVGEWNVYAMTGAFAGRNTIERGAAGCVLHEHWRAAAGSTGHSLNFVDPQDGRWRQIWLGANHMIDYDGGLNARGQMILTGEITYFDADGARTRAFRGAWTPQSDGAVVQHFQQWDAEAETWSRWALLTYVPADADPNGADPAAGAEGPILDAPPAAFDDAPPADR